MRPDPGSTVLAAKGVPSGFSSVVTLTKPTPAKPGAGERELLFQLAEALRLRFAQAGQRNKQRGDERA